MALAVPALVTTGTPASSAQAIFSPMPHAGKLKALMCTATPGRGVSTCCAQKRAVRPSCTPSPSGSHGVSGSAEPRCA